MSNEHEGQGGSYVIGEDGERKLVERTNEPGPKPAPSAVEANQNQPADAGFFMSAVPADQPTTME